MRQSRLANLNFMALCCVLGLFTKKLINPLANVITESLHIPGGISTGFSIMFLVIAVEAVREKHCGTLMAAAQGLLALALGRTGSMGILMPIGFIVPGMAIDLIYCLQRYSSFTRKERMVFSNGLAALTASVTANLLVFHLRGPVLWVYLGVSALSGSIYGIVGEMIVRRLEPVLKSSGFEIGKGEE